MEVVAFTQDYCLANTMELLMEEENDDMMVGSILIRA